MEYELSEDLHLEEVTSQLKGLFAGSSVSFFDFFTNALSGNGNANITALSDCLKEVLLSEWQSYRGIFAAVLMIGILSAVFSEFGRVFDNRQIADISYYIIYLMMVMILLGIVQQELSICEELLDNVSAFSKILIPVFCLSVGLASGQTSAITFYEIALLMIFLIERLFIIVVLPMIYSYSFLAVMNGLTQEERFHGIQKLLQRGINFVLKAGITMISGLSLLQGMISPVLDHVKSSSVQKLTMLIPGIGGFVNNAADVVYGSAVLVKNAVGVAGILLLLILCAGPVMKILIMVVLLKIAGAVVGIVADQRMNRCIDEISESGHMLFMTSLTSIALFIVTIAIVAVTTNRGF